MTQASASTTPGLDARPHAVGDTVIELQHVSVRFAVGKSETFTALHDVNLTIRRGSFVSFIGPSGCGKSTMLNLISGLLPASEGRVLYDGEEVKEVNPRTGYITQRDLLLPWRTLEKNVSLALELRNVPAKERREQVDQMLERVGLKGFEKSYPAQLSGGMRKRAGLARTLIYRPQTLLMDEPFAAVDAILRVSLHEMLMQLWEREKITVLFVTHDLEEALLLSDQVIVFGTKPGRILHLEDVPFKRPRDLVASRSEVEFGKTWSRLWNFMGQGQGHVA